MGSIDPILGEANCVLRIQELNGTGGRDKERRRAAQEWKAVNRLSFVAKLKDKSDPFHYPVS
jgi:hypothetical protein